MGNNPISNNNLLVLFDNERGRLRHSGRWLYTDLLLRIFRALSLSRAMLPLLKARDIPNSVKPNNSFVHDLLRKRLLIAFLPYFSGPRTDKGSDCFILVHL